MSSTSYNGRLKSGLSVLVLSSRETRRLLSLVFAIICGLTFSLPILAQSSKENNAVSLQEETYQTPSGEIVMKAFVSTTPNSLDPFTLTLDFQIPNAVYPAKNDIPNSYGDYNLESLEDVLEDASGSLKHFVRSWTVYPTKRGKTSLPPIPVVFTKEDGTQVFTTTLKAFEFNIPETDDFSADIESIAADHSPIKSFPFLLLVTLTAIVTLLTLSFVYLKKRAQRQDATEIELEQEDAFVKARRLLNELRSSKVYLENRTDFYSNISTIVREYLANRFDLKAEERTTSEIIETIDDYQAIVVTKPQPSSETPDGGVDTLASEQIAQLRKNAAFETLRQHEIRDELEAALKFVDLVKFANQTTTFNDASVIFKRLEEVVETAEASFNKRFAEYKASFLTVGGEINREEVSSVPHDSNAV